MVGPRIGHESGGGSQDTVSSVLLLCRKKNCSCCCNPYLSDDSRICNHLHIESAKVLHKSAATVRDAEYKLIPFGVGGYDPWDMVGEVNSLHCNGPLIFLLRDVKVHEPLSEGHLGWVEDRRLPSLLVFQHFLARRAEVNGVQALYEH